VELLKVLQYMAIIDMQCILAYPNVSYLNTSIIQTPKVTVLLEYFIISVHSIRVNVCFMTIALDQYKTHWASVEQIEQFWLTLGTEVFR